MNAVCTVALPLLAQVESDLHRSYLDWMLYSMGPFYSVVIPLSALAVFIGACIVVAKSQRPAVIAAYLVFLPFPLLVGIYATFDGIIGILSLAAFTHDPSLPVGQFMVGWVTCLLTTFMGFLLTAPSYFVLAIGLFVRTALAGRERTAVGRTEQKTH